MIEKYERFDSEFTTAKYSITGLIRTKLNSKNSLTSGFYIDYLNFDLYNRDIYANLGRDSVRVDVQDNTTLYQAYSTWKHRFNTKFLFNAGLHAQYYSLNEQLSVEPRFGLQYVINGRHMLSAGFGLHNQIQSIYTSFVQTETAANNFLLTNTDLDYTTSRHAAITYDWNISENLRLKAETYYQQLNNVPVERKSSSFSSLNTGASFVPSDVDSLINNGTGSNYGIELTIERFFDKGYYFLITSSLFESNYKGSDDIKRNTAFNTQYVLNALAGKEWRVGKKRNYLVFNVKLTTIGGKYLTPIDQQASSVLGRTVFDEANAYSVKQDPYFRMDVKISYRKEYKRSTLEAALDLQNVTGNQNIFAQSYNPRTNSIVTQYQQGFFPVPFVRLTF